NQHIEFDSLAPDTVEEMIRAMRLLEIWTAKAHLRRNEESTDKPDDRLAEIGKQLLEGPADKMKGLVVLGENMERSSRRAVILKPGESYHAYREMIHYYAVRVLMDYLEENGKASLMSMKRSLGGSRVTDWINLGGQLVPEADVMQLQKDITAGKLKTWNDVHKQYDKLWDRYPRQKQKHAMAALRFAMGTDRIGKEQWQEALDEAIRIQQYVCDQVYLSRKKDYQNHFRKTTFRNPEEMEAVVGKPEDNSFVNQVKQETADFKKRCGRMKKRA
ncbi:MAG: hypothetical protein ACLFVU_11210, partial [Phycisphaerae bacterium]